MDKLKNKQYKSYDKLSRYSVFPIYYNTSDKKWVCGTTAYLDDTTQYQTYTVIGNESYDVIALEFYNNPTLYWVICDFNRVQDCFSSPGKGTVLKIPTLSNIRFTI